MRVWVKICVILVMFAGPFLASAQTKDSYDYSREFAWGINKNTSGGLIGGLVLKWSKKLNDRLLETKGVEFINVKNPQETRRYASTGNSFIYGKSNYLYAVRLQYGRDLILFKKAPQQGVEIKLITAIGPTIGVVAPYYIQRAASNGPYLDTVNEQYNPQTDSFGDILGPGNVGEGLFQSKIQMGANAKLGFNFELGTSKAQITGFEVGFLVDAYLHKVVMMPTTTNYAVFPTLYFTLFYGHRK